MRNIVSDITPAKLLYKNIEYWQSHFQCSKCGEVLTLDQEKVMRKDILGRFCNNSCYAKVEDYQIILNKNYYHIVDNIEKIKDYHWWHASYDNPSNIEFITSKDTHVGQYDAISQIISDKREWFNTSFYLYELELKHDSKVFPYIIPDYGVEWEKIEKELKNIDYDVFVYINSWEGVGQLSLIAKRSSFLLIDRYDNTIPKDLFDL